MLLGLPQLVDLLQTEDGKRMLDESLIKACRSARGGAVVALLIAHGANINFASPTQQNVTPLTAAVRHNSTECIRTLKAHGADLAAADPGGRPWVHAAIADGLEAASSCLIEEGVDPNTALDGLTVLGAALSRRFTGLVKVLLTRGADPNMPTKITRGDKSTSAELRPPLLAAIDEELADVALLLIDAGADLNICDGFPPTAPLQLAAERNMATVVAALLNHGVHVDSMPGLMSRTPLCHALRAGHDKMATRLIDAGADVLSLGCMEAAISSGLREMVICMLELGYAIELLGDCLPEAVSSGKLEMVEWLLQLGLRVPDETVIMAAAKGQLKLLTTLIEHGGDPNPDPSSYGHVGALMAAVRGRHEPVVKYLLSVGSNPNLPGRDGLLPLHYAASRGMDAIVKLLLDAGSDVEVGGPYANPFWSAVSAGASTVQLLLEHSGRREPLMEIILFYLSKDCYAQELDARLLACLTSSLSLLGSDVNVHQTQTYDSLRKHAGALLERTKFENHDEIVKEAWSRGFLQPDA
eukprot:TRINITY_DN922_c0_g1_i1.p2 TRINITY_DN922_c0_g1~~TRINITY_DN922_c0_g1_i1.p2  ORF type:complete len:526 (-),score=220.90 TRINITY_DN922_c0_g1_i1:193-1770(-)